MKNANTRTDVIIIGGGLAGLSAASYLARAGRAVTLFEKSAQPGGRAVSQNYDGYAFNHGIHAIYTGGATSEVLQELGVTYRYGVPKETFLLSQGQFYPFPASTSALLGSRLLKAGDKFELARVFAMLPRLDAKNAAHMSIQQWIEQSLKRPLARQLMVSTARVFVYSSALDLVSAEVFIAKLQRSLKHPVHYVEGGWQTLVDGLRKSAEQAGAHIVTGSRVVAVDYQDGKAQGVQLQDGSKLTAEHVILATSPNEALKLLDKENDTSLRKTTEALIPARVACLDVALKRLPQPRYPVVQDLENPRFLSAQSAYTRVAPQGGALISAFKQLDPLHLGGPKQDERELEDLLDTAQPGWRDLLVKRVFLPRIEALGMLPSAKEGGYASRPAPTASRIANLYLVGDWIGEGFLADPSLKSARQVAQLILQQSSRPVALAGK